MGFDNIYAIIQINCNISNHHDHSSSNISALQDALKDFFHLFQCTPLSML